MRTGPMAKAMKDVAKLRANNEVLVNELDKLQMKHDRLLREHAALLRESAKTLRCIAELRELFAIVTEKEIANYVALAT